MNSDSAPKKYKYKLKAEDFVKLFLATNEEFEELKRYLLGNSESNIKRENNCIQLEDTEIVGEIIIKNETKEKCSNLSCKKVKVEEFSIECCSLGSEKMQTRTEFSECEIGNLIFSNNKLGNFKFKDCEFENVIIESCNIGFLSVFDCNTGNFEFQNNSSIEFLQLSRSALGYFHFNESRTGGFKIDYCVTGDFEIYNKCSIKYLDVNNSCIGNISIEDSSFGHIEVNLPSITGNFKIEKSQMNSFSASQLCCSFSIWKATILQFALKDCQIPQLRIGPNCKIEVYVAGGHINRVYFRSTNLSSESLVSFTGTSIYSLLIDEFSMLGYLYFRHITKAHKEFEWINPEELIKIFERIVSPTYSKISEQIVKQNIKRKENYKNFCEVLKLFVKEPTIQISQSSLGKTEFTDCPLGEFRFEFNNSKIIDCFVSGGSIPTKNVHIIGVEPKTLKEYEQKASFFNQFKKIFEAQGDIYHATQFQAKWADEQMKLLELIHNGEKGWFNTTFSDLWILKLNKWSNLHGESWPRAFGWIMVLGLAFYLLYLFSIGRLVTANEFDFNLIGYYFEFLNPAHKFNFINEGNIASGWTVIIDLVWRIIAAYLIYQFIAAFRKHTKKQ